MDGRLTWTDCDEAGDYVVPNVLSPRDLVFRPDNMDETVPHTQVNSGSSFRLFGPFWSIPVNKRTAKIRSLSKYIHSCYFILSK